MHMDRYRVLVRVLDQLRAEAPKQYKSYHPPEEDVEMVNAARSLAFIHLFLKVRFGLLEFSDREKYITEGSHDGGIDAFYIDSDRKTIYFVQSKFRHTAKNFEEKTISAEELLAMDIDRILGGNPASEDGTPYNGRIQAMVKRIRDIEDIGRYHNQVIILANAKGMTRQKLCLLTGGFVADLIDHARSYRELLFPLVSGTFFTADRVQLSLTLSNKNAGAKISYSVQTQHAKTEITVVFVPTREIAKAMLKYKNAILKYNPRSYLEHEGQAVNHEIRSSIENRSTNEFALFNNGITILSDETYLNERIGQKDRAQLSLLNPQIINGGQTAYTLSQIYKDNLHGDLDAVFGEKEVLVKIITFDGTDEVTEQQKLALIEDISKATNSQTNVTNADRRSNEPELQALQLKAFERLGLFMERKRGEFTDGIREGYLSAEALVDRNTFLRAAMIANRRWREVSLKKIAARCNYATVLNVPDVVFADYGTGVILLRTIQNNYATTRIEKRLRTVAAHAYVSLRIIRMRRQTDSFGIAEIEAIANEVGQAWGGFLAYVERSRPSFIRARKGKTSLDFDRYMNSAFLDEDVIDYFVQGRTGEVS